MAGVILHPRTALMLQHVEEHFRQESTLEQVLDNDVIKGYATGDELTKVQRGLVAATVSLMQDRLIAQLKGQADDLRRSLEEQRYLLYVMTTGITRAVRTLYSTPLLTLADQEAEPAAKGKGAGKRALLSQVLTWGNLVGLTGIVIAVVATFYTKAYASYKDRADSLGASLGDSVKQIETLRSEKTSIEGHLTTEMDRTKDLSGQVDYWKTTAETRENTIAAKNDEVKLLTQQIGVQKGAEQLQAELKTTSEEMEKAKQESADAKAEIARLKQQVEGEHEQRNVYKKLADDERKRYSDKLAESDRLHKEANETNLKLDRLRSEIRALGYQPGA